MVPQIARGIPKTRAYGVLATPSQSITLFILQKLGAAPAIKFSLKYIKTRSDVKISAIIKSIVSIILLFFVIILFYSPITPNYYKIPF